MQDLSAQLLAILARYVGRSRVPIAETTRLVDIGIDCLDIPMILLDAEDRFGVTINGAVAAAELTTAGDLIALTRDAIAAKHRKGSKPTRKKSNWMSTSARA